VTVDPKRYRDDIAGQSEALRAVVDFYSVADGQRLMTDAVDRLGRERLVVTGMGASYFALEAARSALASGTGSLWVEETGLLTESVVVPPSSPTLIVSQSGETIEARNLIAHLRQQSAPAVVVTREPTSTLAGQADVVLPLRVDADLSVAIKTYTGTLATLAVLADHLAGGSGEAVFGQLTECADVIESTLDDWAGQMSQVAGEIQLATQVYALGRRHAVGSALGTALLVKETAKRACEGLSSSQFRHGAIEVASADTAVVVFADSDPVTQPLDLNLLDELVRYGSRVVVVTDDRFPVPDEIHAVRVPGDGWLGRSILAIVPMQLLAHRLAVLAGVTPGAFRNTVPVISHA
jgi:glutamine---fructose-6-phosphate transaminase (isomerizing)